MYSRNYTADRNVSGIKPDSNSRLNNNRQVRENIPVKSFTDNFAYDRFNRMGNQIKLVQTPPESQNLPVKDLSEVEDSSPTEIENNTNNEIYDDGNVLAPVNAQVQNSEAKEERNIITRLKDTFDADTLLIILAAAMLIFSDNATNDKLTPLALLAILFF